LPCLRAGLEAKALVGNHLEFFGMHVVDHAHRRALRGIVAVIFVLSVIALALDVWLSVDMSAEVDAHPVRALYVEAVPQASNRAMPGLQDGVFPFAGWLMMDRLLADGNERPAFAFQPVGVGGNRQQ